MVGDIVLALIIVLVSLISTGRRAKGPPPGEARARLFDAISR
jgi:hypothetical protein